MMVIPIGGQGGTQGTTVKTSTTGVGNPGSNNGTGALLIIFANKIKNEGKILSNGVEAPYDTETAGSSGAGSINVFYIDEYTSTGTIETKGFATKGYLQTGGAGGTGSISVGQLLNGIYTSMYKNY